MQFGVCLSVSICLWPMHYFVTYPISTKLARGTKGHKTKVVATWFTLRVLKVGPKQILYVNVFCVALLLVWWERVLQVTRKRP